MLHYLGEFILWNLLCVDNGRRENVLSTKQVMKEVAFEMRRNEEEDLQTGPYILVLHSFLVQIYSY